ncbi:MAG: 2-oxo acid dehydrogenase subunit E2 [Proteobacteria bacterium]|nr:2-oxo acid dehydrogenase subunit E2 [Pseudomonadota bacterium]
MTVFTLPDLGEGLKDAEIVTWHVAVGDHVVADQPLVSVETDKAVVEVPSPQAGRIARLCAALHDHVAVGAPLVEFAEGTHADAGTVVGELAGAAPRPPTEESGAIPLRRPGVRAAPAARALAAQAAVDLATVEPSGPDGTITRADVERVAAAGPGGDAVQPLRGTRRSMAANMARAGAAVVPASVVDEADVGDWRSDEAVTVRLIRAVVAGCVAAPALNAWFNGAAMTRRLHDRIDLGLAVDSEDGLFVPVLRDVGRRDAAGLHQAVEAAKAAVCTRSLAPEDLRGQTITLSNFGTLAGRFAALTVMPPQVAILGAGRIAWRATVKDGRVEPRRMLPLSLTFDHRVVTGGEAARFLAAVLASLQNAE